ncbi:hypothetical protein DL546_008444 [Coniochaeta pulveracea]|uniref:Uncharacterized protein n=1 Tax=Coniochaeta pulveracea TaxID=177199 RepID=A0A420YE37_9PEZI|nr:hypothetical protein DL546_008444 [Coniochaeta pulveracea]
MERVKRHTREYLKVGDRSDVNEKYGWTGPEDPAGLDGASLQETSKRFADWVGTGDGRREQEQDRRSTRPFDLASSPRSYHYLHVDEGCRESVVSDEEKACRPCLDCSKAVQADSVLMREQSMWVEEERGRRKEEKWRRRMRTRCKKGHGGYFSAEIGRRPEHWTVVFIVARKAVLRFDQAPESR